MVAKSTPNCGKNNMNKRILSIVLTILTAITIFAEAKNNPEFVIEVSDRIMDTAIFSQVEKDTPENADKIYDLGSMIGFFDNLPVE